MSKIDKLKNEIKEAAVRDNAAAEMHSCIEDIRQIIDNGRKAAYFSVNAVMVQTYWNIGKRIVEEEQNGKERADYGKKIIKQLAAELSFEYGNGFSERNLRNFRAFYLKFPDSEIWQTRLPNLTWSHFCRLLSVDDDNARYWYLNEANEQMWSVRTLDRNVSKHRNRCFTFNRKKDNNIM